MKVKKCSETGCRALLPDPGSSRCPEHQRVPFETATRTNSILYQTPEWRRLKRVLIERDRVCSVCGSGSNLHVDHVTPPRGDIVLFFDIQNLQLLCEDCHRIKTAREISHRGWGSKKNTRKG
jgi:5-methylcytosine-specific restriction protein A